MPRATTLDEARKILDPKPLSRDQLDELFVETGEARDPEVARRDEIAEILEESGPSAKVLLASHGGTGKSTELVKLRSEHEDRFVFVQLSIIKDGDPAKVDVESLLVLIVEAVLRQLGKRDLHLDEQNLESIYGWFAETFEVSEKSLAIAGELGAGVDTKETFWGKLLGLTAYLKTGIKTGSTVVSKTVRKRDGRLSDLAAQCGLLLSEAELAVFRHDASHLVLIIEDLDKIPVGKADSLFIDNPAPLAGLPVRAVFTAPIFLFANPRAVSLNSHFDIVKMPMIKIEDLDGTPYKPGLQVIRDILAQRIDLAALIDDDAVKLAVTQTGGVLRHLFEVLRHATRAANQSFRRGHRTQARINKDDVRYGLNRLKGDLVGYIGVMGLPEEFASIKTSDLYDRLKEIRQLKTPQLAKSDPVNLLLMQAHALLDYNGQRWHRIHPLVVEFLADDQSS